MEVLAMAIVRKKTAAKPGLKVRASLALKSPGKGKPVAKKPAAKPPAKDATKPAGKAVVKPVLKSSAKPPARPLPKGPPTLNKGAAAAKALAEARAAAAAKAIADSKRAPKLVPATANAIRPGAAKAAPVKGKANPKPPAEVRPLGVLPPDSLAVRSDFH